jgi:predicted DNA-binding transcriptional regulator
MREVINELSKIDISKAFDVSDKQYKKGSRVLNVFSGTIDWSMYDKISDCLRPKNKRSDKGRIDHERLVIEKYGLQNQEVFRYEYRIKKTQTVKREINKLLGREYLTVVAFEDLFTAGLLKSLVINSWNALIKRPENQLSLFGKIDSLKLFLHILDEAKKRGETAHSMNNALTAYGLATAIRDHGAKETRGAIFEIWNTDHPERLTKKIKLASELTAGLPYSNNIVYIDTALNKYELITLNSLENEV